MKDSIEIYLEQTLHAEVSAGALAFALKSLKPYFEREEITINQFIDNPKHIHVAYLLGAKTYESRFIGKKVMVFILTNRW